MSFYKVNAAHIRGWGVKTKGENNDNSLLFATSSSTFSTSTIEQHLVRPAQAIIPPRTGLQDSQLRPGRKVQCLSPHSHLERPQLRLSLTFTFKTHFYSASILKIKHKNPSNHTGRKQINGSSKITIPSCIHMVTAFILWSHHIQIKRLTWLRAILN